MVGEQNLELLYKTQTPTDEILVSIKSEWLIDGQNWACPTGLLQPAPVSLFLPGLCHFKPWSERVFVPINAWRGSLAAQGHLGASAHLRPLQVRLV